MRIFASIFLLEKTLDATDYYNSVQATPPSKAHDVRETLKIEDSFIYFQKRCMDDF